jgi:hypothetical protein
MKTSTHTMSSRLVAREQQDEGRTCSQNRRNPQEAIILKTSLLITNLNKSIHQWNTRVTSKQLSTERLKLITKSSQEVMRAMKLKSNLPILVGLTSGRRQLRTKSVNLMPNSRELIEESINDIITLTKKLLLMNSSKKSRLSCGLIATAKKCPHLMIPLKLYNISRKANLHAAVQSRRTRWRRDPSEDGDQHEEGQPVIEEASWGKAKNDPPTPKCKEKIVGREEILISGSDTMLWIILVFIWGSKDWIYTCTGGGEYVKIPQEKYNNRKC